jgi:hypothetical protein
MKSKLWTVILIFAAAFLIIDPGVIAVENMVMNGMYGQYTITRESSGTSWQPEESPFEAIAVMQGDWMLMGEARVNGIYDFQQGNRGGAEIFSTSMFMFMAQVPVLSGTFGFRSMFSLDPLMGPTGYPLIFQTGETADGKTELVDRQHPHDLLMELAATYSFPILSDSSVFIYAGLPGEPALGPPAFMHRASGMDFPTASITHHWLDSTHVAFGVVTFGYVWDRLKVDASAFRGREPDQYRWNLETGALDSASGRITFNPLNGLSMQTSYGYIRSPEQLNPETDVRRTTASISYNVSFENTNWQTMGSWGRNNNIGGSVTDGYLVESELKFSNTHTVMARAESVAKDALFPEGDPRHESVYDLKKFTFGYIYEFPSLGHVQCGLGGTMDVNFVPESISSVYGNNPLGYYIFARLKFI